MCRVCTIFCVLITKGLSQVSQIVPFYNPRMIQPVLNINYPCILFFLTLKILFSSTILVVGLALILMFLVYVKQILVLCSNYPSLCQNFFLFSLLSKLLPERSVKSLVISWLLSGFKASWWTFPRYRIDQLDQYRIDWILLDSRLRSSISISRYIDWNRIISISR